jgi:hypothetical protein
VFKSTCYPPGARGVVLLPAGEYNGRLRRAGQDRLMLDFVVGQSCQRQQTGQGRPANNRKVPRQPAVSSQRGPSAGAGCMKHSPSSSFW